ncbi:hypothetical protein FKM82_016127 [Ascaphus truei]
MAGRLTLLSLSFCCLGMMPASGQGQVEKVKVMFTPMICRVRCQGERCTNHCEKGNMTTVYSDELSSRNREQGFRAYIDECQESSFCQNGDCTNTRGSYSCICKTGYLLDSSRSSCISHHVISEAKGPCFRILRDGGCSLPILRNITKQICCCSRVGKAWGKACERCPPFGTEGFKETCPAGPGYHYSASDLRINTRFVGQDQARVPVQRQPGSRDSHPPTPAPSYLAVTSRFDVPEERRQDRPIIPGESRPPVRAEETGPRRVPAVEERDQGRVQVPDHRGPARVPVPAERGSSALDKISPTASPAATDTRVVAPAPDMDECRQNPRPCANGRCENTVGSFRCACSTGFSTNPQGTECTDIDECASGQQPCASGHCENTPGSYRCVCPAGFTLSPQGTSCTDIDECRLTPRRNCLNGRCENTPGSFRCVCPPGFTANAQGTDCQDIDECRQTPRPCGSGRCQNTPGSFRCSCPTGFRLNPQGTDCMDKDECQQGTLCQGGRCANTQGSFQCACPTGFKATSDKATCADIDECQERGGSLCGTQHCENTLGSYRCIAQCDAGYRLTASGDCADVNECANSTFCGDNAVCQNLIGSFRCTCNWGYEMSSEGQHCVDVDECLEYGVSLCGTRRCQNTPGSYKCITDCEPGYQLSSSGDCRDINECLNKTVCGDHAVCQNLVGSYQCLCDQGYEGARGGRHCVDVNECLTLQGVCGMALCENVEGSFLCICPSSNEEFDPMTGKCIRSATAARPMFPRRPSSPRVDSVLETTGLKECYYNLEDPKVCENVLARNLSQAECCCSVGEGWGTGCQVQRCPATDTAEFQSLCPGGAGYITTAQGFKDVDECQLYGSQVCKGGVCVNKVASYSCYCSNGYYYDVHRLECVE